MANKYHLVVCDDNIETEFSSKGTDPGAGRLTSNEFVLHQYVDKEDESHKKYALFKQEDSEALPDETKE